MQTSSKTLPKGLNKDLSRENVKTRQSDYINTKKEKLQKNSSRREKFKSEKNVQPYKNVEENKSNLVKKSNSNVRYDTGKKPFEYQPQANYHLGNAESISQLSEERKMPDRPLHTRAGLRAGDQEVVPDFGGYENRSVEYRPLVTPPTNMRRDTSPEEISVGVQNSPFGQNAEIQNSPFGQSAGIQNSPFDKSVGAQNSLYEKSVGAQNSPFNRSAAIQYSGVSPINKSVGGQVSVFDQSAGQQVGSSLEHPFSEASLGAKGVQFDTDIYNKGIQADEEPLKDNFVQCDLSENDVGIQADADLVDRSQSAGSDSLLNPLMQRELDIVDKNSDDGTESIGSNQMNFS